MWVQESRVWCTPTLPALDLRESEKLGTLPAPSPFPQSLASPCNVLQAPRPVLVNHPLLHSSTILAVSPPSPPPCTPQLQSAAQLEKSVAAWSLQLRVLVVVACSEKELAR